MPIENFGSLAGRPCVTEEAEGRPSRTRIIVDGLKRLNDMAFTIRGEIYAIKAFLIGEQPKDSSAQEEKRAPNSFFDVSEEIIEKATRALHEAHDDLQKILRELS